ncbi:hypothetical protein [Streptomyces sp. NPDC018347]|uniref:hypothetical protein n=1 Tax=Streptomyces sp. NPDC018347 TaxID=3157193 RepID=UPI0033F99D90
MAAQPTHPDAAEPDAPEPEHDPLHLRQLKERLGEHHRRARAEREEAALENAIEGATFDLGADIARPAAGHEETGYDVDADLGAGPVT